MVRTIGTPGPAPAGGRGAVGTGTAGGSRAGTSRRVRWIRGVRLPGDTRFLADLGATLEAWAAGLAVTVVVAVPLGVMLGSLPGVRVAAMAVVEFRRPIPSVALIAGIDDVDPVALETHRAFGFSRLAAIRMVALPSAAPFIATGIRLASAVAIILDIAAGFITGRINGPGLGAFIADASTGAGNTALILAATAWAGLLGLVLDLLLVQAQRRLLRWHDTRLAEAAA